MRSGRAWLGALGVGTLVTASLAFGGNRSADADFEPVPPEGLTVVARWETATISWQPAAGTIDGYSLTVIDDESGLPIPDGGGLDASVTETQVSTMPGRSYTVALAAVFDPDGEDGPLPPLLTPPAISAFTTRTLLPAPDVPAPDARPSGIYVGPFSPPADLPEEAVISLLMGEGDQSGDSPIFDLDPQAGSAVSVFEKDTATVYPVRFAAFLDSGMINERISEYTIDHPFQPLPAMQPLGEITATPLANGARLSWNVPAGDTQPVGFDVEGGNVTSFGDIVSQTLPAGATEAVFSDLVAGDTYRFRVAARSGYELQFDQFATVEVVPDGPTTELYDTVITDGPAAGGATIGGGATFAFDSVPAGAPAFECAVDSGAFELCDNPLSLTGLLVGQHTFAVRAVDGDGSADPQPATVTWTVVAPLEHSTAATLSAASVNVPYRQVLAAAGGLAPYRWSLDAGAATGPLALRSRSDRGHHE